jgi:hypothetical protein
LWLSKCHQIIVIAKHHIGNGSPEVCNSNGWLLTHFCYFNHWNRPVVIVVVRVDDRYFKMDHGNEIISIQSCSFTRWSITVQHFVCRGLVENEKQVLFTWCTTAWA